MASPANSPDEHSIQPEPGCDEPERPPTKRRRIAVACGSCRNRKSRCDGARPKCNTCQVLGLVCVYAQGDPTLKSEQVTVTRRYLNVVETRLSTLESAVRQLTSRLDHGSSDTPAAGLATQGEGDGSSSTIAVSDPADGMGSIMYTDEEDAGYFGPSSNITFTRHITRAISATLGSPSSPVPSTINSGPVMLEMTRPESPRAAVECESQCAFTLPPHEELEALVARYFGDTGMLYPYIHEKSFMETYHHMKSVGARTVRRSWLALLNMMLAQATTTCVERTYSAQERISKSEIFYRRAMTLCRDQLLRCASVELVQVLLVMGQYLQSAQRSIKTWNIHGLAVKGALQLGLHSQVALQRLSPLEREIRTRVWYGCVMLDRTLSMTFGRPSAVPECYVCSDLPIGYPPSDGERASERGSLLFYNSTIGLYKIMWTTMETLYGCNLGCKKRDNVFELASRILQIENQLLEWKRCLDPSLQLITPSELSADDSYCDAKKFRVILTLRYLNLRLLAHRPVVDAHLHLIGRSVDDYSQYGMLQQLGTNCLTICVESAGTIIDILHHLIHSLGPKRRLLGAWWYSLYYVFNASLAIFAVLLIDSKTSPRSGTPWKPTLGDQKPLLERGLQALQALDHGNEMSEKYARITSSLIQMISATSKSPSFRASLSDSELRKSADDGRQTIPCTMAPVEASQDGANGSQIAYELLPDFAPVQLVQPTVGFDTNDFSILSEIDFLNEFSASGLFR